MITIVIASYQYGHLAAHCIESVLSQSKQPSKVFFVDDGANDCHHLPDMYPDIEYVFRRQNLGTVKNFQDMLMRVETDYVMFLGADNWLRSDAIELLSEFKTDIVTYDIIVTGELKSEIHERVPQMTFPFHGDFYWNRVGQHHGSMMYKTALGQQIGYSQSNSKHPQEDWNLWDQMIERGATVGSINQGLLYYRRHKSNFLKYCSETNEQSMLRQNLELHAQTECVE
jgi:glycosyltransferase involved in cell wall biosynthesis